MYKSGSVHRFDRIWNVSTDENTGKHVEIAIKRDFAGVDWVFINCYLYRGNDENPTGITFESADKFRLFETLKLCVDDTSALYGSIPNLLEDKAEVIISTFGSGQQFAAYVDKIYDNKEDFIIGKKLRGYYCQQIRLYYCEEGSLVFSYIN